MSLILFNEFTFSFLPNAVNEDIFEFLRKNTQNKLKQMKQ